MKIEFDNRNDKNIDIENENNSNENDDEDDFRHLKNNTFLKSDESECESENYTNDEIDDEKNNDDEH